MQFSKDGMYTIQWGNKDELYMDEGSVKCRRMGRGHNEHGFTRRCK